SFMGYTRTCWFVLACHAKLGCALRMCFFFQGGDGIRVFHGTGVQTCALPIYLGRVHPQGVREVQRALRRRRRVRRLWGDPGGEQIGRATCRERVLKWFLDFAWT